MALEEILRYLPHKRQVEFALYCAKSVKQIDPKAIDCIKVVEKWLKGKATLEECVDASYAAADATAHAATASAAHAAASVYASSHATIAYAAIHAAGSAASAAVHATVAPDDIEGRQLKLEELKVYLLNSISPLEKFVLGIEL